MHGIERWIMQYSNYYKKEDITDATDIIREKNIVVFSPHYDDFPLMMAGYIFEMKQEGAFSEKRFTNINIFSRSNYQLRQVEGNKDLSLERIKYAVGNRLIEDMCCMDELVGRYQYTYRLLCEYDCSLREKKSADSEMETHRGTYEDFDNEDWNILNRLTDTIGEYAGNEDTALVFPIGFKEHFDHFIVREAGLKSAQMGGQAGFYFAEEKPLSGLADESEIGRIHDLIRANNLSTHAFWHHPEEVVNIVFRHYISQVEDVYRRGIMDRSKLLQSAYGVEFPVDCIYKYRNIKVQNVD